MGAPPDGFEARITKDGRVRISHHDRVVTTVAGSAAAKLTVALDDAPDEAAAQHLLARATGNYRRGNEGTESSRSRRPTR